MDKDYEHNEGHIEGRCQDMMGCAKDRLYDEKNVWPTMPPRRKTR